MPRTAPWLPLDATSRAVALEVLRHGPLSRSELARRLDLSPGSLTRLTRPLLDAGLLCEGSQPHATEMGRPARPLDVVAGAHHFAGVRLQGDTVTAVVTDLRATQLDCAVAPLPDHDPDAVVATVADLVATLASNAPPLTAVGLALGGIVESARQVLRAPFLGWGRVPLAELVQEATGLPAWVQNDVVALTTAEHWFGAVRGREDAAIITVGAGVGGGLVVHGRVVDSPAAGVGFLGHIPLGLPGPRCPEGHVGCSSAVLTDSAILAQAAVALRAPVTWSELVARAGHGGDPVVGGLVDDVAVGLGRLVALVANTTLVPFVLVSGEAVDLVELLEPRVREEVAALRDPGADVLEIALRRCPTEEWARGAAAVAVQRYVLADS